MPKYRVIEPLRHNKKVYMPGSDDSELELEADEAQSLVKAKVVELIKSPFDQNAETYSPEWTNGELVGWGNAKYSLKLNKSMKKEMIIKMLDEAIAKSKEAQ